MKKPTIICVDDESIVLTSLKDQLKRHLNNNYTIETVESGDEALELFKELKEEGIDVPLIISDQMMPGMKGSELLSKVKNLYRDSIQILLTGQANIDDIAIAINEAKIYRYISKPWQKEDLNVTVSEGLKSFEKDRQLEIQRNQIKQYNEELEEKIKIRTAEVEAQKEEAEMQRTKAEKSEQFKQQFLANMSHEIRTPMNAVMGMTNLVLDTPLDNRQKFYLDGIKKSSNHLLHIINDILDISKIEAGKMELEQIDFSISDSIEQIKQTLKHRANEKGLELLTSVDSDTTDVVIGDPVRVNQVLINLVGNAIKFTEKGSVAIEVSADKEGTRFSIIDTGVGIPKDKREKIFESFAQANASDTRKFFLVCFFLIELKSDFILTIF